VCVLVPLELYLISGIYQLKVYCTRYHVYVYIHSIDLVNSRFSSVFLLTYVPYHQRLIPGTTTSRMFLYNTKH